MYRPTEAAQMTTPMLLQSPVSETAYGVTTHTWQTVDNIMCNFKTYGGTEKTVDGVLSIEDTAQITCWYRPDIKSDCRLIRLSDNAAFEILGEPENIEMRNQFLKFKIRRIKGGA